jgi:DNA-binding transcriptional MerR regulator
LGRTSATGRRYSIQVEKEKANNTTKTRLHKMNNTETQNSIANTLKEVAKTLSVPESTLRLYRDEFEDLVPTLGTGRRRRYTAEGAEFLRRIVEWRRDGRTAGEIRDDLSRERQPRERVRRRNTDDRLDEITARLAAQAGEIAMLRVEMGALRAEVQRLVNTLREDPVPTLEDALVGRAAD